MSSAGTNRFPPSLLELPVDLQYLSPDKQREPDADIRKMLIEAIMLVSRGPGTLMPVRSSHWHLGNLFHLPS